MPDSYNELLTIDELCKVLQIGRNTAYQLLNPGFIPGFATNISKMIFHYVFPFTIVFSVKLKPNLLIKFNCMRIIFIYTKIYNVASVFCMQSVKK